VSVVKLMIYIDLNVNLSSCPSSSDFNNITASDDPQLSVRSMGDSNFTLSDGLVCRTPIIMIQKQVMLWDAPLLSHDKDSNAIVMPSGVGWEDWTDDVWRVFEVASPRPGE